MKLLTSVFLTLYLLTHAVSLFAHTSLKKHQHVYDVTQFDIAGVKLGMSLQEAQAAVIESLEVTKSAIKLTPYVGSREITQTKNLLYFSVVKDKAKLLVFFKPAIPLDKNRPLRVHTVSYTLRPYSKGAATMRSSAIKKYGYPTSGIQRGDKYSRLEWCWVSSENEEQGCSAKQGAHLNFIPYKITMSDPRYTEAVREYLNGAGS